MKKVFAILIILAMSLSFFAGCQSANPDATQPTGSIDPNVLSVVPLTAEVRKEIHDVLLGVGENVVLSENPKEGDGYYGIINECIVVRGNDGVIDVNSCIRVADCTFVNGTSFRIFVYRDGEICELQEAYDEGWLTEEHIQQLEVRHSEVQDERFKAIVEAAKKHAEENKGS